MALSGNEDTFGGFALISAGQGSLGFDGVYLVAQSGNASLMEDGDFAIGYGFAQEASCTHNLCFPGTAAKTLGMEVHSTAASAGNTFTVNAGGSGTNSNLAGGDLVLATGRATGNGAAKIDIQTVDANQGTGTTARAAATRTRFRDGHIVALTGAAPAISGSCGTTPSCTGCTDVAGRLTTGTGSPTSCVLTFNKAYTTNAPVCVATNENAAARQPTVVTTTTTLTLAATFTASDKIHYICIGVE